MTTRSSSSVKPGEDELRPPVRRAGLGRSGRMFDPVAVFRMRVMTDATRGRYRKQRYRPEGRRCQDYSSGGLAGRIMECRVAGGQSRSRDVLVAIQ